MSTPRKPNPRPKPEPNNTVGVIRRDEIYVAEEAYRRLRWRRHSRQQARRLGLKVTRFGSRDYVLGRDLLDFFDRLAQQQHTDSDGGPER